MDHQMVPPEWRSIGRLRSIKVLSPSVDETEEMIVSRSSWLVRWLSGDVFSVLEWARGWFDYGRCIEGLIEPVKEHSWLRQVPKIPWPYIRYSLILTTHTKYSIKVMLDIFAVFLRSLSGCLDIWRSKQSLLESLGFSMFRGITKDPKEVTEWATPSPNNSVLNWTDHNSWVKLILRLLMDAEAGKRDNGKNWLAYHSVLTSHSNYSLAWLRKELPFWAMFQCCWMSRLLYICFSWPKRTIERGDLACYWRPHLPFV